MRFDLPTKEQGGKLLALARRELLDHFCLENAIPVEENLDIPCVFGGVFATLEVGGELRGCIGFLFRAEDLVSLTRRAVVAAAEHDPRFAKVTREEVPRLRVSITVLASPEPFASSSEIVIGRHGLLVEKGGCLGLLLPQVAEKHGWDSERFLAETCRKAALPSDSWREEETVVRRFEAVRFEEE
ncbi:MAG: AmmeMemoRadiSam system protein A [Vicinamibacteria bacterium]